MWLQPLALMLAKLAEDATKHSRFKDVLNQERSLNINVLRLIYFASEVSQCKGLSESFDLAWVSKLSLFHILEILLKSALYQFFSLERRSCHFFLYAACTDITVLLVTYDVTCYVM